MSSFCSWEFDRVTFYAVLMMQVVAPFTSATAHVKPMSIVAYVGCIVVPGCRDGLPSPSRIFCWVGIVG